MFNKPLKSKIVATTTFTYQGPDGPLQGVTITAIHPLTSVSTLKDLVPSDNSKIKDYERKVQEIIDGESPIEGSVALKFSPRKDLQLKVSGVVLGAELKEVKLTSDDENKPALRFKVKCAPVSSEVKMGHIHFLHGAEAVLTLTSDQIDADFKPHADAPPKKDKKQKKGTKP